MDYQVSGWHSVIWGAILVSIGAFFVSGGWTLISKSESVSKWVKKFLRIIVALLFITSGSVLVGVGGTKTTLGWKQLDNASQKKALIIGLAREWRLNESYYKTCLSLSFDANAPNLGKEHFMYPQFRTSAQDSILTSALFDPTNKKDKELFWTVIGYEECITNFNTLLAWANEQCAKFPEDVGQQKRKEVYLVIRDKAPLHMNFKIHHKMLSNILEQEYSWALDEAKQTVDIITFEPKDVNSGPKEEQK
jgi:hypothetical protein